MYQFTVEGSGVFPFDMLRYDGCYPKDSSSASNLSTPLQSSTGRRDLKLKRKVTLVVAVVVAGGEPITHFPTIARWESYRWTVSGVKKVT